LEMLPNVEPDLLNHVKEYKNFFNTQWKN
jgi:hypothetical protein